MKPICIILLLFLTRSLSFAQTDETPTVEKKQFTYHLLAAASLEFGIGQTNTLRISGPLDFGLVYNKSIYDSEWQAYLRPMVQTEFRHYYNLKKRVANGKSVSHNSGNFIAPAIVLYGPAIAKTENTEVADFATAIGALWGIQRNYGKNFNFQLSVGPGLGLSENKVQFTLLGGLSLGFRIQ